MADSVDDLVLILSPPKQATMATDRYRRVIGFMRGVIAASDGTDLQIDDLIEESRSGLPPLQARYWIACDMIRLGYRLMCERMPEAEVLEALEWPIRNAYSGFLKEWE